MKIGISGGARTSDRIVEQVESAEADGFPSIWFPGAVNGEPLLAMARAAKATTNIELGTAVLQTYPCHPVAMAGRLAAAVGEAGRSLTLGVGPSHAHTIETMYGMSYDRPGRHTEDYLSILAPLLRGEGVEFQGEEISATAGPVELDAPVPLLVSALGPRLLRVAGELADGTITWMADAKAVDEHVAPLINRAAESAGRPRPRIVVGIPVAVHDDVNEARDAAARQFAVYGQLPNYRRILERGAAANPGEIALVGDEQAVAAGVAELFQAGATDVWAAPFVVGDDRSASRARTRTLLKDLANR